MRCARALPELMGAFRTPPPAPDPRHAHRRRAHLRGLRLARGVRPDATARLQPPGGGARRPASRSPAAGPHASRRRRPTGRAGPTASASRPPERGGCAPTGPGGCGSPSRSVTARGAAWSPSGASRRHESRRRAADRRLPARRASARRDAPARVRGPRDRRRQLQRRPPRDRGPLLARRRRPSSRASSTRSGAPSSAPATARCSTCARGKPLNLPAYEPVETFPVTRRGRRIRSSRWRSTRIPTAQSEPSDGHS